MSSSAQWILAVAILASPAPARAQCNPQTEGEAIQLALRMRDQILELEAVKRQIEVERHILVIYPGGVALVTPQQAGTLFGNAVFMGVMNPDSIEPQVRALRTATTMYLRDHVEPDLARARECFERANQRRSGQPAPVAPAPTPSAAPSQIDWPAPMDWLLVKGAVRGTWLAACRGVRKSGPFRLEFLGNGSMGGVFEDDSYRYPVVGTINADGRASGTANPGLPEQTSLRWSARFERSGVALLGTYTLDLMAAPRGENSILIDCTPGYMRPEG